MTVLSDLDIIDGIVSGHVVCLPLRVENIKGSSIDLTLGEWFWRCDAIEGGVFNPYSQAEIDRYFAGPFQSKPYESIYRKVGWMENGWPAPKGWGRDEPMSSPRQGTFSTLNPFEGIPDEWPVIVLRPGERILGHSHEFVGIRAPGTSMLKARSSTGRFGVKVCDDAGWGDPDYIYRWTFEVRNDNAEAIILRRGERVAQLVLLETGEVRQSYGTIGQYQAGVDLKSLVQRWTPRDMLPKPFKDTVEPLEPDVELYEQTVERLSSGAIS